MNLMETAIKVVGSIIKTDEKGNRYVLEEDFQKLDANSHEKAFLKMCFAIEKIEIIPTPITKEDRPTKVKDYEYGNVKTNDIGSIDQPTKSDLEYSEEELIFENYDELDEFLESDFIPRFVAMKVNAGPIVDGKKVKNYPSIQLQHIVRLRLNEQETDHVFEYLQKHGIRVGGTSQDLEAENYDYVRTYATKKYQKPLTEAEEHKKFCAYFDTQDKVILQELIERNLRLVSWAAYKLSIRHNIDQDELLSYGYEGLIYAIDNYNPYLGNRFSSYAVRCIEGHIKKGIPVEKGSPDRNKYYNFETVKRIVEKEWDQKFDGSEEMVDEILDLMQEYYRLSDDVIEGLRREKTTQYNNEVNQDDIMSGINLEGGIIDRVAQETFKNGLLEALSTLTDRERKVLLLRFGFIDGKCKTLEEVGKEFNATRERIRQIEAKALRKLRHPSRCRMIRNALDAYENPDSMNIETNVQGEIFNYDNIYHTSDELANLAFSAEDENLGFGPENQDLDFSIEDPELHFDFKNFGLDFSIEDPEEAKHL